MAKWSLLILRSLSAQEKLEIANSKGRADGGVGGGNPPAHQFLGVKSVRIFL
jgi:hypothetical protein